MYARTLTQQPTHPPKHQRGKTCSLFFTFWYWFWCTCLRRDEFSSFKFCSIFYNISFIFAWFSRDFAIDLNTNFVFIFWCNYLRRDDFSCFNFCSNFNEKSSILACFLMQLASACRRIDKQADKSFACFLPSILACFLMQLPSACRFSWFNFCSNFDEKLSISSCFLMQLLSPWWFFDVWTFCHLKKSAPSACGTLT